MASSVTMVLQSAESNNVRLSSSDLWHNVHTKFHEFLFIRSLDIKCEETDVTCEKVWFGVVGWDQVSDVTCEGNIGCGWVRLVMRMRNGVIIIIIIPPRDFEHPSRWYYRVQEIPNYEFRIAACSITSIQNFINFRPLVLYTLNANRRMSLVRERLGMVG
jgi:hypothetical protein